MKKRFLTAFLSLTMAVCLALSVSAAMAQDEGIPANEIFQQVSAAITYLEDGSIQIGDGDSTNGNQQWTNAAGLHSFSSDPFSITFLLNGIPGQGARKDSYFFLNESGSSKTIWFNVIVVNDEGTPQLRVNINIQDQNMMADNFVLDGFDFGAAATTPITITYNGAELTASVSYGTIVKNFDLTKAADGSDYQHTAQLPAGEILPALMNTYGGIIITAINGQGFAAPDIEEPFEATPNLKKDFMTNPGNTATVAYEDGGIVISDGEVPGADVKLAMVNESYTFADTVEFVYRYNGLQPAVTASRKNTYFVIHNDQDPSVQLKIKMFVYCTSDDAETAQYVLHTEVFTGEEGTGQYFAQNHNLLWECKDYENTAFRIRYESEKQRVKFYNGDQLITVDLTKKADGTEADTSALPTGEMRFQMLVQYGGVVLERVNDQNFAINYGDYEVSYTDRQDIFTEESDARIAYRNGGILLSNNDTTSIAYAQAFTNPADSYQDTLIFEWSYQNLWTYDPSIPLTVMKSVIFRVEDADGHKIALQPFLYKNGNTYMMHINITVSGSSQYHYENYYLHYDFDSVQALQTVFYLKYDSVAQTVEVGMPGTVNTLPLDGDIPKGTLRVDPIEVQLGGIYLRRINQYSFVVENPTEPDPVDPEFTDFGLVDTTFEADLSVTPVIDYGGFEDAVFTLAYRADGEEEWQTLEGTEGTYSVTLPEYGLYTFRYELSFEGTTLTAYRTVEYRSSLIGSLEDLYDPTNGTYTVTDQGLMFSSREDAISELVYGTGRYEVAGVTTVKFKMCNLVAAEGNQTINKEVWIDFTDGKDGVWVNVFAFSSAGTMGSFPAYVSVFTFKNGDKGTQNLLQDNVPLGFNFDVAGELDPDVTVVITYNPYDKTVSIGKEGSTPTTFQLIGRDVPQGKYGINTAGTYGSFLMTELNGFSFANEGGEFTYPAPIVDEVGIPTVLIQGEKLVIPTHTIYDIFDWMPSVSLTLKGPDGGEIAMAEEEVDGVSAWTATMSELGSYELTITAENAAEALTETTVTVRVIEEDTEAPEMTFAEDAFSDYRQGDRPNKFEVKKDSVITLPSPTLTDDSGLEVSLVVTVTDPRGNTSVLNELSFTGDTIGTYVVEYIATDVSGKETRQLYNFVVMLLWEEDPGQTTDEPGCAGGCSSSVGQAVLPGLVLSAAAAVLILRKKEQN